MAWEKLSVETQRLQLVKAYIAGEATMMDLCLNYGVSPKTGYKWYHKYLENGEEGLKDLSKAPHNPHFKYAQELIDIALDYKRRHLKWGPKKILTNLGKFYPDYGWPGPTRLYEIYKENGLVNKRKYRSRVCATAPLGSITDCNDTWTVDFKGWFLTGDGRKCEPLTIMDTFSRYLIQCIHLNPHTTEYVWPVFDKSFRQLGLPNRMRFDNGSPFGSVGVGRLTKLSVKLIKAGVTPEWISPGHPEENGRHERFHSTLKQETANPPKDTLALQIQAMELFQEEYNYLRPHEPLDMKTPGSCYQSSRRVWNGIFKTPEYETREMLVRKVQANGIITIKGENQYIGEALIGEYIGLKLIQDDEYEVYYWDILLGILTKNGMKITRIEGRKK